MTLSIVSRAEWNALPPKRPLQPYGPDGLGITCHWEGPALGDYGAGGPAIQLLRSIQSAHQNHPTENYADIAYNYVIDRYGVVYEARGFNRTGANGDATSNSADYAVCFMLGQGDSFPDVCRSSFAELRAWLIGHGCTSTVHVHSDWVATACPGPDVTALARQLDGTPLGTGVLNVEVLDMVEADFQRINQLMSGHTDDLAGALGKQLGQLIQLQQQTNSKLDQLLAAKGNVSVPPSLTYVLKQ